MIKTQNQKPIEHDIHLKYSCNKCGQPHWLSFLEASTKNFKIVCDCGKVFKVKRVKDFKLTYYKKSKNQSIDSTNKETVTEKIDTPTQEIPIDLLRESVKILVGYGYEKEEAVDILSKSYHKKPTNNVVFLVKQTLESVTKESLDG